MKSFIKIVGILFLFTSLLFLQCKKEEATIVADQDMELRSTGVEPCEVYLGPTQQTKHLFVPVQVPGYTGCIVYAEYVWIQLGSAFAFTDFAMHIPESGCENLATMNKNDFINLSRYVEAEGKRILLNSIAILEDWTTINNVKSFRSICSQKVKCMEPHVISNEQILGYRGGGGGKPIEWSTRWERCGGGCCVTTETYAMLNGDLVITGANTVQYGDCESAIPVWPKIMMPCIAKIIVDQCSARCPN